MKRLIILLFSLGLILAGVAVPKDTKALDSYVTYDQLKEYQEKQAEKEWSAQLTAHAQTLVGKRTGTCVLTLRKHFGVPRNEVQGFAKSTRINSKQGKIGSVIVFKNLSKWGHVGITIGEDDQYWYYFHGNIDFKGTGRIDKIAKSDPRISGFRIINYKNI